MARYRDPIEQKRYLESLGTPAAAKALNELDAEWRSGQPWSLHEDIALCQIWARGSKARAAILQRTPAACNVRGTILGIGNGAIRWRERADWFDKIEQLDEVLIGWRLWRVVTNGRDAVLRSVYTGEPWPAGAPMEAHELRGDHTGVHAYKQKVGLEEYGYKRPAVNETKFEEYVFGQVALWGRVIEHEDGFRAEFAYPLNVHTTDLPLARIIARSYGIEAVHTQRRPRPDREPSA